MRVKWISVSFSFAKANTYILGCPKQGYYGENCAISCPENCVNGMCHIVYGTCFGCEKGFAGTVCDKGLFSFNQNNKALATSMYHLSSSPSLRFIYTEINYLYIHNLTNRIIWLIVMLSWTIAQCTKYDA